MTAGVIFLVWLVEIYAFRGMPYFSRFYEHLRKHTGSIQRLRKHLVWILGLPIWEQIHQIAERVRNFAGRGPNWKVPLRVLVPYYIGGSLYALARAYILWEAIFTLRALTPSAYKTVDWSAVLPHFEACEQFLRHTISCQIVGVGREASASWDNGAFLYRTEHISGCCINRM